MTMILQLLVAAVAVGLTVAGTREYKQNVAALEEAAYVIKFNLLSMEGNIPLLNDARRHYAEIVYVIYYYGVMRSGGLMFPYYEVYQQYLNHSAPVAINNPDIVIDEIKELFETVDNKTSELKELIDACVEDVEVCNKIIDDKVRQNIDQYGYQADVLFAAGIVAYELKKRNNKFEEVSRNLQAHQYVISTAQDLKDIMEAVTKLLLKIYVLWA